MNSKRDAAIHKERAFQDWKGLDPKANTRTYWQHRQEKAFYAGYDAGLRDSGGEWVAVSEKLPEKTGRYETTTSDGYVCNAGFISESQKWVGSFDLVDPETKIIAWREISEPYTQEKTNDKE